MKVLIVDDSAEIRSLIRIILEHNGHEVAGEAEDGPSALKAFAELRPDVVLLDIIMPGKSGVEVLEDIRKIDPLARVIMVTAVEQNEINRRLMLIGADGIIYKPFAAGDFEKAFHSFAQMKPAKSGKAGAIKRLAAGGLSKCMLRANDATSGNWELCEVSVFSGKPADLAKLAAFGRDAAAVQINIRNGPALSSAMIFRAEDIGLISGSLVKGPLYRTGGIKELEEGLMIEIGNIILNALMNPLVNALKRIAIPTVPMLIKGGPAAVAAGLSACLDLKQELRIISASLAMRREGHMARAGVVGLLPEELAAEIELGAAD
ncbi:MAG: hypothetical protein A2X35_01615 [Elusimicrobia bacterium GWA2_61_42]|nr:MAG: hypothetical protein A2X35_01615 [Elusimicrobia bacterium GWA2_61_42]OGR76844.1 MAG: hypothetical protein A2X38_11790 [Elusimicrobia bacterium GWC2_61_25]